MSKTWVLSALTACGLAVALAVPAVAHVTVQPGEATQGGFTAFAFRVPNERPDAGTVQLEVSLPAEHPISVRTKPMAGWTVEVMTEGEAVRTITWTAEPGVRINPGEYQEFDVAAGPLPTNTDMLIMPTRQSYDNGEVVAWNEPPAAEGAPEPEHPAPVLELISETTEGTGEEPARGDLAAPVVTGASTTAAAPAVDSTARWLGGAGLFLGALGLGLGTGAVLSTRRGGAR